MCHKTRALILTLSIFLLAGTSLAGEAHPSVCVARVANSSGKPILVDRVNQELVNQLNNQGLHAVAAPTMTMLADQLALSASNQKTLIALHCDWMLLSEIAQTRDAKNEAASASVLHFALFEKKKPTAALQDSVELSPSDDATESVSQALPSLAAKVHGRITRTALGK